MFYDAAQLRGLEFDLNTPPPALRTTTFLGAAVGNIASDTATHGDYDMDGLGDLVITSPHDTPEGRGDAGAAHVFFGQPGGWPETVDLRRDELPLDDLKLVEVWGGEGAGAPGSGDILGYSAASGDFDADGWSDLIVNEMQGDGQATADVGNLVIVSGELLEDTWQSSQAVMS